MVVRVVGIGVPTRHALTERRVGVAARVVRVGLIRVGRRDEEDVRAWPAARRPYVERQLVDVTLSGKMHDVGAAPQVVGNPELEVGGPPGVVKIVLVEMY